jgi:methylase of polypeptide subunit release factors
LKLFDQYLTQNNNNPNTVLDLGCGSGVLSFILAKHYKSAKIFATDSNKYAVETC